MLEDGIGKTRTRFNSVARLTHRLASLVGDVEATVSKTVGRCERLAGREPTGKFQMINVNLLRLFVKVAVGHVLRLETRRGRHHTAALLDGLADGAG